MGALRRKFLSVYIRVILIVLGSSVGSPAQPPVPAVPPSSLQLDLEIPKALTKASAGPMSAGQRFVQSFRSTRNGLAKVEFLAATFAQHIPSGELRVSLASRPDGISPAASAVIPASTIADNSFVGLQFEPIRDSGGKTYYLILESRDIPGPYALTLWLTGYHLYPDGEFWMDGKRQPNDLILRTFCVARPTSAWSYAQYFLTPFAILGYIILLGLGFTLLLKTKFAEPLLVAPAIGLALITALSTTAALCGELRLVNCWGAVALSLIALTGLFLNRAALRKIHWHKTLIILTVAVIFISCLVTLHPSKVTATDPAQGPWRSFVPFYPSDGLIPYDAAALVVLRLPSKEFIFEPGWSVTDRTHMLTFFYLHFCELTGIQPRHWPGGEWEPIDAAGFWLLRATAFAVNVLVLWGIWSLASALFRPGVQMIAVGLAAMSVFMLVNISYTWPKMLCAYLLLLAVVCAWEERRQAAGLLLALAYWAHPLALMFIAGIALFVAIRSFRKVWVFVVWLVIPLGLILFAQHQIFGSAAYRFLYYPLAIGYYQDHEHTLGGALSQFHSVRIWDLMAVRLYNFIRIVFPSEVAHVPIDFPASAIGGIVAANWWRLYEGSLWGSTGLLMFPAALIGAWRARMDPKRRTLFIFCSVLPVLYYLVWFGFLCDGGGRAFCQPVAAILLVFAADCLYDTRRRVRAYICGLVGGELLLAYTGVYASLRIALGLLALSTLAAMVIVKAGRQTDCTDLHRTIE
jgi:hypothetical protein